MKIGKVSYNGTSSDSLGIFLSGSGTYNAAELDATAYEIPGRNGDLIIPNNRYKNIEVTYPAFVPNDFENRVQAVRNWMRSAEGYKKIEDNYDSTHYRMGMGVGVLEFTPAQMNRAANLQLVFNCKPQRFLKTGDTAVNPSSGATISNPTQYDAKPEISFKNPTSSATLTIGSITVTATSAYTGVVVIDCETQNIYSGSNNLNSYFTVTNFPVLKPGNNTITYSGVTNVTVIPHYWEL